ncbi:ADP-ribose pyrophosphatase YjhB (NUDIX family) [Actinocorallia herbida]|uniref:ADP-ribose pyrophosphatase YjhB (NUDIX family) n=2 Tax=Actinocorallia herbida TaxID=58109 RepID=A0A3N1CSZ9_9ACTN|nr:ADP-ribose pyrophosphatase YjhB (NUDIX family) [Actinocorallia herbida]
MRAMTTPPIRKAARAILLDPEHRVLLLRYDENGGFWATPGGSLDPGETPQTALARELREELGITAVDLGPELAIRTKDHPVGGRPARQVETYFAAHIALDQVRPEQASHPDNIQEHRWWTLTDITKADQTIYPIQLGDIVRDYLETGPPAHPVSLT